MCLFDLFPFVLGVLLSGPDQVDGGYLRWLHRTCVCVSANVLEVCEAVPGKGDVMRLRQINQSVTSYQSESVCVRACVRVCLQTWKRYTHTV